MSVLLNRADGSVTSFTTLDLEAIATHLLGAQQAFVESGGVRFWLVAFVSLLLVDVTTTRNRRLTETFELTYNADLPFGLRFRQNASVYNVYDAIRSLGFFVADSATLASLNMAQYALGGAGILQAGQLVADVGAVGVRAARLRTLTVGTGLGVAVVGDNVQLSCADVLTQIDTVSDYVDAQLPLKLSLTGGTLTGPLIGTSAAFTSATVNGQSVVLANDARLSDKRECPDNSISTIKLQDNAVTSAKIASSAVTSAKIADAAITDAKLATAKLNASGGTLTGNLTMELGSANALLQLNSTGIAQIRLAGLNQSDIFTGVAAQGLFIRTRTDEPMQFATNTTGTTNVRMRIQTTAEGGGVVITNSASIGGSLTVTGTLTAGSISGSVTRTIHHCTAYQSAAQSIPVGFSPWTKLTLGATKNVRGTNPYNSGTNRFVAPVAGMYAMKVQWGVQSTDYFTELGVDLRLNGVSICMRPRGGALVYDVYLNTTDYLEVFVAHSYGSAQSVYFADTVTFVQCTLI